MTLTSAGWPRPRVDGWPVPWVSPADNLANMDPARYDACASGAICAVCGGDYPPGARGIALVLLDRAAGSPTPTVGSDLAGGDVLPMDNAVMHHRCVRLALAWCPELKRVLAAGELIAVDVPANSATVEVTDEDAAEGERPRARGLIDGADCRVVDVDELLRGGQPS